MTTFHSSMLLNPKLMSLLPWLPDGYSQLLISYVFGPSGFWTMAPLHCAAKFDVYDYLTFFQLLYLFGGE